MTFVYNDASIKMKKCQYKMMFVVCFVDKCHF